MTFFYFCSILAMCAQICLKALAFSLCQITKTFHLQPATLPTNKIVILSLKVLKPGIDMAFLWMKAFSDIYFQNKKVLTVLTIFSGRPLFLTISLFRVSKNCHHVRSLDSPLIFISCNNQQFMNYLKQRQKLIQHHSLAQPFYQYLKQTFSFGHDYHATRRNTLLYLVFNLGHYKFIHV